MNTTNTMEKKPNTAKKKVKKKALIKKVVKPK